MKFLCILSIERESLGREHSRWKAEGIEIVLADGDIDRFSGSRRPRSCADRDSLLHVASVAHPNDPITSSIVGVGATRGGSAVNWGVTQRLVMAWILTFPICGAISYGVVLALRAIAR